MTVRCFVLEDQAPARRVIESYCARLPPFQIVGSAAVPDDAVHTLRRGGIDVLFLDLGLPQQDGFGFLQQLHAPPLVIVTTAFGGRALEGFTHGVVDYLVKPFAFERFRLATERAQLALRARRDEGVLTVPMDRDRREFVRQGDIASLSADGDYVVIRLREGRLYTLGPLTKWLERLPSPPFVRIHRSHVINTDHISATTGRSVVVNGENLPVSSSCADALQRALDTRR